ncbi:unnamed protein product [Discosporangium mesarthrocarpum]
MNPGSAPPQRWMVLKMRGKSAVPALPKTLTPIQYERLSTGSDRPRSLWSRWSAIVVVAILTLWGFFTVLNALFLVDTEDGVTFVSPSFQGQGFTVRMNTWRRNDLLKKSVEHFGSCSSVQQVQVIWSDQENSPPPLSFFAEGIKSKVFFEMHDSNSLSHRFHIIMPVETDGVFSVDDDVIIPCDDLQFAFETWLLSPSTMVGFHPRLVTHNTYTGKYSYLPSRYVFWTGIYNSVLTKASFLHKDHLVAYGERVPQRVLDYIDEHRNCEDLAMAFVVARMSNLPPIWVKSKVTEIGNTGISSAGHRHFLARSKCIDFFVGEFGNMPLIRTKGKKVQLTSGLLAFLFGGQVWGARI